MASSIDPTKPESGRATTQSVRDNFTTAKNEITALQEANVSLAASSGSSLVGFIQSGTGAVATDLQTESRRAVWAEQFGAVGDGVTDCTTAFANALVRSKHVRFGEGTFLVDTVALVGSGFILEGDSPRSSILKARTSSTTKLLDVHGSGSYATNNVCKNFTLDMTNMTDLSSRYGLYQAYAYNGTFEQVFVTGIGTNKLSYYAESPSAGQGVYTMDFRSCDFGSTTGKIKLLGTSLSDAITTHDFYSCAFGSMTLDYCVNINVHGGAVQGTLNKFTITNTLGVHLGAIDVEGASGTYLVYGSGANHIHSIHNQFSGFSGTYESGTVPAVGVWLDPYGSGVYRFKKPTVSVTGVLSVTGNITGTTSTLNVQGDTNGLVRHVLGNANSGGANRRTDVQIGTANSATEAVFVGVDQAASTYKGYIDNRSGGDLQLQRAGTANITWKASSALHAEAYNFEFGTTTGSKFGTATTQKIGFWNATPVVQPSGTGETTGFTAGAGTNVTDQSTFTGNVGATAYRISDVVKALKQIGLLAS